MVEIMTTNNLFEGLKLSSDHTVATTVSSTSTATCNSSNISSSSNTSTTTSHGNAVSVVDENQESIDDDDSDHHDGCDDKHDDNGTEHNHNTDDDVVVVVGHDDDDNGNDNAVEENQDQDQEDVPSSRPPRPHQQQHQVSDSYLPDKESYWESSPPLHLHCWVEGQNAIRNEMSMLRIALLSFQSYYVKNSTTNATNTSSIDVVVVAAADGSGDDENDAQDDSASNGSRNSNNKKEDDCDEEKTDSNDGDVRNNWIIQYLEDVWSIHESHVHDYLFNEEYILIPYFSTRFRWPSNLECTRMEIECILDRIGRQIHNLQNRINSNDAVVCDGRDMLARIDNIVEEYKIYERTLLNPYLLEEQDKVMPLMRSYFTPNEVRAAMKVIASRSQKTMLGSMIHNLEFGGVIGGSGSGESNEQTPVSSSSAPRCEEFMKREGITPYCLAWYLFLEPIYIKYQIVFLDKIKALQEIGSPKNKDENPNDDGETVPTITTTVPTKTTNEPSLFQTASLYLMEKFVIPSMV